MTISFSFIRFFFCALCILFSLASIPLLLEEGYTLANGGLAVAIGAALSMIGITLESVLKKCTPRTFYIIALGLFFGTLLGEGLFSPIALLPLDKSLLNIIHCSLLLVAGYAGIMITAWSSEEIALSIPYIKFTAAGQKKKELLLDMSVLSDPRILDLANSGLVDGHMILPKFVIKELQTMIDDPKSKKCLENIKRLESIETLSMRVIDTDYPDTKDISQKLIKMARALDANLLSADISRVQQAEIQGVKIINIHLLANALKPITQSGEFIDIKVQRYGKESRQGVGYLDDGTMVVVNGGADYIGNTISCQVLSVKHTGSGRLIFCNAPDEEYRQDPLSETFDRMENGPSNYFVADYERNRL